MQAQTQTTQNTPSPETLEEFYLWIIQLTCYLEWRFSSINSEEEYIEL